MMDAIDMHDMLAISGLVMLGIGLAMVSMPLALCVVGGLLTTAGMIGAWNKGRQSR